MKKRLISLFLIIATMSTMLFAGCGGSSEKKFEALTGDHSKTMSINTMKAMFKTSDVILLQDKQQYNIGGIPIEEGRHLGVQEEADGSRFLCFMTLGDEEKNPSRNLVSIKNAPVPIITQGDKIYGRRGFCVQPIKFVGFSPLFINWLDNTIVIEEKDDLLNKPIHYGNGHVEFSLVDDNDKEIRKITKEEMHKLEYGQRVCIYWCDENLNTGIYYADATCAYYSYVGEEIELKVTGKYSVDNKELLSYGVEYNEYDTTQLEKGYYAVVEGNRPTGVFVVQ